MDAQRYLATVQDRMLGSGFDAGMKELPSGAALVGYRSDFRLSWAATKLHLFVAVKQASTVSRDGLDEFSREVLAYGKQTKGRFRGLQSGIGVIAALVSTQVEDEAARLAQHDLVRQFGAFAWPAIVDLEAGQVISQVGNPRIGRFYNSWMREQIAATLPSPVRG